MSEEAAWACALIFIIVVLAIGVLLGVELEQRMINIWANEYCISLEYDEGNWNYSDGLLCYHRDTYTGNGRVTGNVQ